MNSLYNISSVSGPETPLSAEYARQFDYDWRCAIVSLFSVESLGARAIYSFMKEAGYSLDLIFLKEHALNRFDMPSEKELDLFIDLLRTRDIKLAALAVRSPYLAFARELTTLIHAKLDIPVLWGGTAATVTPDVCIESGADFAVCGEGEETFAELVDRLARNEDPTDLSNLWYRNNDGPVGNPVRPLIQDLNRLPVPDLEDDNKFYIENGRLMDGEPWRSHVRYDIMSSRGCPFKCTYCSNSLFHKIYQDQVGSFVRQRSVAHLMAELRYAKDKLPNLKTLCFVDEVFGATASWLNEFKSEYLDSIALSFECLMDPRMVTEEKMRMTKESGCAEVNIGIQSGSERVRYEIFQRHCPDEKVLAAAALIKKFDMVGRYDIITDNPFETSEDKRKTLELLLKLPNPWILNMYSLNHLPHTVLTEYALEKGVIKESDVAGYTDRCLRQFVVSFDFPRKPEDLAWNALYSLSSKWFIPKRFVKFLSNRDFFMRHPKPLTVLARTSSLIRLAIDGVRLLIAGRIDLKWAWRFARSIKSINR